MIDCRKARMRGMFWATAVVAVLFVGACAAEAPKPAAAPAAEGQPATAAGKVHPCAGADRWFPGDGERLGRLVDAYLAGMTMPMAKPPVALIAPHAGYQFSGSVAGKGYATLKGRSYKRVILFGLSHRVALRGASVLRVDAYETPLGRIPVDIEARDAILKCSAVTEQPEAHATEHSVENQLPMLQRAIKDFKMVEVLVSEITPAQRKALADAIRPLVTDGTLMVASSDFTHYGPNYGYRPEFGDRVREGLLMLNDMAMAKISQIDPAGWDAMLEQTHDTICGRAGIGLMLKIVEPWDDIRAARVAYDTSGQITGDWTNSVTYAAVVFWRAGDGLTKAEQATLLRLARDTVTQFLKTGQRPEADPAKYELAPALKAQGAAFVTLKNAGELRGCIGHVMAVAPLHESVTENACHACRDPRFTDNRITEKEAPALSIEISVLSPIRRLTDLESIQIGRDGLVMKRGQRSGIFLPQVPIEQNWNRQQYLENLCRKAGLPVDALKDPQTEFYRFTAQVFGEEKAKGGQEKAEERTK